MNHYLKSDCATLEKHSATYSAFNGLAILTDRYESGAVGIILSTPEKFVPSELDIRESLCFKDSLCFGWICAGQKTNGQ